MDGRRGVGMVMGTWIRRIKYNDQNPCLIEAHMLGEKICTQITII